MSWPWRSCQRVPHEDASLMTPPHPTAKPEPASAPAIARRGLMLVVSSPSGAGKTTITRTLLQQERAQLELSISATTRARRSSEVDGVHYHFMSEDDFVARIERGQFLEHAEVHGNRYGTPKEPVERALSAGKDVLFDIDWQGAAQVREVARADMVGVFILPPSMAELESRLRRRAQDSEQVIQRRLAAASDEIRRWVDYDYVIVNDDLDTAMTQIRSILEAERLRRQRQTGLEDFVSQFL